MEFWLENRPWGKTLADTNPPVVLSLAGHCRDVAAVTRALLAIPLIRRRLARLAGRDDLDPVTCERIAALAFLHDFGKVNVGFWRKLEPGAPNIGHIAPLAAIFRGTDRALTERALRALGTDLLVAWDSADGSVVGDILDAIISHHGRPWPKNDADATAFRRQWQPRDGYDPIAALADLSATGQRLYPLAYGGSAAPLLPAQPRFVHAVCGLVQLADWIGSSQEFFAFGGLPGSSRGDDDHIARAPGRAEAALRAIGLDAERWRSRLSEKPWAEIEQAVMDGRAPYPLQSETAAALGRLVVLESETGSGKTEAALLRFLRLFAAGEVDGLYFALPTRAAAVQLHGRVERAVARLFPEGDRPPVVLAVPGYADPEAAEAGALPDRSDMFDERVMDGKEQEDSDRPWAAQHPKRFLAAPIAVGTVDQALLAALRVKHAHLRGFCLLRQLLVVDEVHASDAFMGRLLVRLIADQLAAEGHVLLLSATLGAAARAIYTEAHADKHLRAKAPPPAEAESAPYPALTTARPGSGVIRPLPERGREKIVEVKPLPIIARPEEIAAQALKAADAGAKVLVIRNLVSDAIATAQALEALAGLENPLLFRVAGVPTLHHSRFAREDRKRLDTAAEAALGGFRAPSGVIVAGTQTLEQSLDIDADLLITDLCPIDVLLQRMGRLHRRAVEPDGTPRLRPPGFETARALVLVPAEPFNPAPSKRRAHGLGAFLSKGQIAGVYLDLRILEATWWLIGEGAVWRIPAMNRALVERATHPDLLETLVQEREPENPAWRDHANDMSGLAWAFVRTAQQSALERDKPFWDNTPWNPEEHITTRLGADDRLVTFDEPLTGPFGAPIRQIVVPGRWVKGLAKDTRPSVIARTPDSLSFVLEGCRCAYSRHGLQKVG